MDQKCKIFAPFDPDFSPSEQVQSFDLNSIGSGISFNENDSSIITGLQNGTIKIWDLETGQNNRTLPGHRAEVINRKLF